MPVPKWIVFGSILLFSSIGFSALMKKFSNSGSALATWVRSSSYLSKSETLTKSCLNKENLKSILVTQENYLERLSAVNRISELFTKGPNKLPIVQTICYSSQAPWLKGKPALINDYAAYFETSKHFIARSLNQTANYVTPTVSLGSQFNVFRKDKNIQFYLVVDLSRCKMPFYYYDVDTNERVLLKIYSVGVGQKNSTNSGNLTPIGRFTLGRQIAVYKPGMLGIIENQSKELIEVFGTRWIPFEKEEGGVQLKSQLGLQGAPWKFDPYLGKWVELRQDIGVPSSDGCIRLYVEDIEELFSIVITKKTVIEVVKQFKDAHLPGIEVTSPKGSYVAS